MNGKPAYKRFIQWAVTDATGKVVITQRPNLPLMAGIAVGLGAVIIPGFGRIVFGLAAFGALFTWAWLETFSGVSPIRRLMGAAAMVLLLVVATIIVMSLR